MNISSQLLCTFTTLDKLDDTLRNITKTYTVMFDTIYVLENTELESAMCCTYNIDTSVELHGSVPEATISLHRKKQSNCLYTINALNLLIKELNGGVLDKGYKIPWDRYKNTILVTAYDKLKIINTRLNKIVKLDELA